MIRAGDVAPEDDELPLGMSTAGLKRAHYRDSRLPSLLLLPQLLVLLLFFFIPAIRALSQSVRHHRPVRRQLSSSSGSTISARCSPAPSIARRSG